MVDVLVEWNITLRRIMLKCAHKLMTHFISFLVTDEVMLDCVNEKDGVLPSVSPHTSSFVS